MVITPRNSALAISHELHPSLPLTQRGTASPGDACPRFAIPAKHFIQALQPDAPFRAESHEPDARIGMKPNPDRAEDTKGTVFIIDGDIATHRALMSLFDRAGLKSEAFTSAQQFLSRPAAPHPCCLILDAFLPDSDGLALQQQLSVSHPEMPLIFFTAQSTIATGVQAIKAGALEFLLKPSSDAVLLNAITIALARSANTFRCGVEMDRCRSDYASLTPRERQVMALVLAGLMNKQIAYELKISEITVKAHRGKIMRKMGAKNLLGLLRRGMLLQLPAFPGAAGQDRQQSRVPTTDERIPRQCAC
jgi:FixJ family two-component response regulator